MGVKCATITPDEARVEEFNLKRMYRSPNGIRNILGDGFSPAHHLFECAAAGARLDRPDCYRASRLWRPVSRDGLRCAGKGKLTMRWEAEDGSETKDFEVFDFPGGGVAMNVYNLDESIRDFARACMLYALDLKWPLYLSTENTIMKAYDGRFKDLFQEVFDTEFKDQFEAHGMIEHRLIDVWWLRRWG